MTPKVQLEEVISEVHVNNSCLLNRVFSNITSIKHTEMDFERCTSTEVMNMNFHTIYLQRIQRREAVKVFSL